MGRRAGFTAESRFFWIRIQIFLETPCFPDLLIRMSGKCPASRTCRFACRGNRQLPGLADSHVRETVSFPDLLIRSQASLQVEFFAEGREISPSSHATYRARSSATAADPATASSRRTWPAVNHSKPSAAITAYSSPTFALGVESGKQTTLSL